MGRKKRRWTDRALTHDCEKWQFTTREDRVALAVANDPGLRFCSVCGKVRVVIMQDLMGKCRHAMAAWWHEPYVFWAPNIIDRCCPTRKWFLYR